VVRRAVASSSGAELGGTSFATGWRPIPFVGSIIMTGKVQGEGDYESARRYNKETREFVEERQAEGEDL
jgi:hypothetical protein